MAVTLSSFSNDQIRMRHKEPYVTEGLNAKAAVNTPPGIYRGFRLTTDAGMGLNTFTVEADSAAGDHSAVYQTSDGYSVTLRIDSGDFVVDLTSEVDVFDKTFVIALWADYTVGQDTTAEVRAYELDPADEYTGDPDIGQLIVLGQVVLPSGGGIIPAANIGMKGRSSAWQAEATEARLWSPLLRNGGFENSVEGSTDEMSTAFWRKTVTSGNMTFETDDVTPNTGAQCLLVTWTSGSGSGSCLQELGIPVTPGQLLRLTAKKRVEQTSTLGTLTFEFYYVDETGSAVNTIQLDVETTSTDAGYVTVDEIFTVPAGSVILRHFAVVATALALGGAGDSARFDDIQLWLEPLEVNPALFEDRLGDHHGLDLLIHDPTDPVGSAARLTYDGTTLSVEPRDTGGTVDFQVANDLDVRQSVTLGADTIGTAVAAADPRIIVPPYASDTDFTCVWESGNSRLYVNQSGRISFVSNAAWDASTAKWVKDAGGTEAFEARLTATDFKIYGVLSGTNNYNDSAWRECADFNIPFSTSPSILTLGAGMVGSDASNIVPRLLMSLGSSTRTLLWEITGTNANIRFYMGTSSPPGQGTLTDALEVTVNAEWDNATGLWSKDDDTTEWASRLVLNRTDFVVEGRTTTAGTWDDTGWINQLSYTINGGDLTVGRDIYATDDIIATDDISAGSTVTAGTNDDSTGYFYTQYNFNSAYDGGSGLSSTNMNGRIYKNSMVKAWALVWLDGNQIDSPSTATPRLIDAFGISALSSPAFDTFRLAFPISYNTRTVNGQSTYGYTCFVQITAVNGGDVDNGGSIVAFPVIYGKGPGTVDIKIYNTSGSAFGFNGGDYLVRFLMFGAEP